MDILRRTVLKGAGASGVLAGLLAAGLLKPTLAWPTTGTRRLSKPRTSPAR